MPFTSVSDFEKSFPAISNLTIEQKEIALEIFNDRKNAGDSDSTAIAKAIAGAKEGSKLSEGLRLLSTLAFNEDIDLAEQEFEILRVGEFFDPRYGKFKVDYKLLRELKKNFDDDILEVEVAVDKNHDAEGGAFAWIATLEVRGKSLFARFKDFTEEGEKLLREKIFKYFSVEFAPFTKVINGTKKTIRNVLRGVALTNRPVIKGMRPALLSEDIKDFDFLSFNDPTMDEKNSTEEEKPQVAEEEEAEQADSEESTKDEEVVEEEAEESAEEEEAEAPEAAEASELTLAEKTELSELREFKAERVINDRVSKVLLSESNPVGFTKKIEGVKEFVASLSEEQFKAFSELVTKVTKFDDSEIGHGEAVENSEESMINKAAKLAEKYEAEGMTSEAAIVKAQKEVFN